MSVTETAQAVPLRVVHVITGLGQGGAEAVLLRLVEGAAEPARHTVVSLTDEGVHGARLRKAGAHVHALGMPRGRLTLPGFLSLRKLIRKQQPDVVQTWMYHADLVGGLAARLAGVKAVSWGVRNSGAHLEKSSFSARMVLRMCARLSSWLPARIVYCAQAARERHEQMGYAPGKGEVIQNGYDLSRFAPDTAARERQRAEWGVRPDDRLLGSVARWDPLKDHDNLLAALAELRRDPARANVRCVLVGRGMAAENTDLLGRLAALGLSDAVILAGPTDDVPAAMNALDLHVLSSRAEGFPNVVAEAMACGTPCVVTDVGDAAAIVGEPERVAPPENSRALAKAMARALDDLDAQGRQALGEACRNRVASQYGLPMMLRAYERTWASLAPAEARKAERGRKLMFIVNNPAFFLSHRLPLALAAQADGFDVHVATMDGDTVPIIRGHGMMHHVIPMSRSGRNPVRELGTVWALYRLLRRVQPRVVHLVTIKPVLYGGIAARLAKVHGMVAAISGLGFVFMRKPGGFDPLRMVVVTLYRLALGHRNSRVIFQNSSDRDMLLNAGVVRSRQVVLVRGAGVDLDAFTVQPQPATPPVVALMVGRLLRDKGVYEYVEAARLSQRRGARVTWLLAGSPDPGNPASVTDAEVAQWNAEGAVQCLGERHDIADLYANAHVAVLPSYREGLPRSLIEAAACGRAVVTTDVPGCRDAIEPNVSGMLVPVQNAQALADMVLRLADDAPLRTRLGEAGRDLAVRAFDIRHVQAVHLEVYRDLTDGDRASTQ
ncbi:Lipid carrier : UDP-N-acetylgalactosaminyltransferase / Alpha-1,3-N-acetylgalactosamine transferase PglA; Putative glycosyltransferase [plant metagenome]|uniref:Lipid carrier: UDP-N-acetylgalactosaminyltransferase / Alpha-1,3-N-acetylgalactosamine transferase PglA Putative glycosyltransferase n=1 Tax=plant metagenome TaxID=1297885 RepID=A0A484P6K1_9ZZZZ